MSNIPPIFEKQLLINNITQLNPDVLHIVKEYVFHQRETVYKNKKKQIINQINNAISRVTENIPDNDGHWIFCADKYNIQFQSYNCVICGNYLITTTNLKLEIHFSNRIFCNHEPEILPEML